MKRRIKHRHSSDFKSSALTEKSRFIHLNVSKTWKFKSALCNTQIAQVSLRRWRLTLQRSYRDYKSSGLVKLVQNREKEERGELDLAFVSGQPSHFS